MKSTSTKKTTKEPETRQAGMTSKNNLTDDMPWLPDDQSIPEVPEGHIPLKGSVKQGLLKFSSEQRAEVELALEQLWTDRQSLARDLGTLAPDLDRSKTLLEQMKKARHVNQKAQRLALYAEEQEALANHEAIKFLNEVVGDIEHLAKKTPAITTRWEKPLTVVTQRREAIAEGIALAKADKKNINEPK